MHRAHPLAADLDQVVERTSHLLRELHGAHLFMTGGTGFIGTWLLESLFWVRRHCHVCLTADVLSRDPAAFACKAPHLAAEQWIRLLAGDVRAFPAPERAPDYVIHAAFDSSRPLTSPRGAFDTLVAGTRQVLERVTGCNTRGMLLVSSGAVYGAQPADVQRIDEDYRGGPDPLSSTAAYGEGKRVAEFLCALAAAEGLPVTIARCFSFLGPGLPLDAHYAAGNFLRDAAAGREVLVHGDGRPLRSYLHAADLAIWLWTLLLRGRPGRAYNVGSDEAISIGDLAHRIAASVAVPVQVRILGRTTAGSPPRYVPDIARARVELGLSPSITLDDAIRRTLDWLSNRGR